MSNLISDKETNFVYFSDWIKSRWKYWPNIEKALIDQKIPYGFLPRYDENKKPLSRDIWVRDYMPLQLEEGHLLGYEYNPDYLNANEHDKEYISRYEDILSYQNISVGSKTNLVIDGGNMVKCGKYLVMTDKVFSENPKVSHSKIIDEIEEKTGATLVIIPPDPDETFSTRNNRGEKVNLPLQHADGLVKWLGDDTVLVNKCGKVYTKQLVRFLECQGLKCEVLDYSTNNEYVSVNSWCYLNFLQVGKSILVPCYGGKEENVALKLLDDYYKDCTIVPVNIKGILNDGGGLNCISWNIKI